MTIGPRHIAVIDIGKTNAKLALVDRAAMVELAVLTRPNTVLPGPPYPHFDTEGHWAFLLAGLKQFQASHGVDGISITTHGACTAMLAADGSLATPVLDYEDAGPAETAADYSSLRPDFALTGSPRLGNGLNLGAQLHWLLARDPGLLARTSVIVTWPQYWGYRLTGKMACDLPSLGCHTDLWEPGANRFSSLVASLGVQSKIAPPKHPGDVLGTVLAAISDQTGLNQNTPVVCGIHDSNASLLPHLLTQTAPFGVVSTGTWVVCMAIGGNPPDLHANRDVLVNVAADGRAVPSARFMGGREYDLHRSGQIDQPTLAHEIAALGAGLMLWPSVVPEGGPFPGRKSEWNLAHSQFDNGTLDAALAFYLALMTAECLRLAGATGPVIVEGPFAANPAYCRMLSAATDRRVLRAASQTGTSIGAALLFGAPDLPPPLIEMPQAANLADYERYAKVWHAAVTA